MKSPSKKAFIRLAILEDSAIVLKGMCLELNKPKIRLCITSDDPKIFIRECQKERPDVAICDLRIWGDVDAGFKVVEKLQVVSPSTKCILFTMYDMIEQYHRGINLGIKAFVSKSMNEEPLDTIVQTVNEGGTYFGDYIEKMLSKIEEYKIFSKPIDDVLSGKEREVAQLLSQGLTEEEIARKLLVTKNTIRACVKNIKVKLGVDSKVDIIRVWQLVQNG